MLKLLLHRLHETLFSKVQEAFQVRPHGFLFRPCETGKPCFLQSRSEDLFLGFPSPKAKKEVLGKRLYFLLTSNRINNRNHNVSP